MHKSKQSCDVTEQYEIINKMLIDDYSKLIENKGFISHLTLKPSQYTQPSPNLTGGWQSILELRLRANVVEHPALGSDDTETSGLG